MFVYNIILSSIIGINSVTNVHPVANVEIYYQINCNYNKIYYHHQNYYYLAAIKYY